MPKDNEAASTKEGRREAADKRAKQRAGRRVKKSDVKPEQKIKLLAEKNPRREGTATFEHFKKYRNGMTVETFLSEKVGGEWMHLAADIERGYVALE